MVAEMIAETFAEMVAKTVAELVAGMFANVLLDLELHSRTLMVHSQGLILMTQFCSPPLV
ncbi:6651_t:CDS:1, partial [Dentiscutata heterogama]